MIGRVLAPLDGSALSEAILPHLRRLVRAAEGEIVLARSLPVLGFEGGEAAFRFSADEARLYLEGVRARLESWGYRVRTILRAGDAADTILGLISETRPDWLALATHGRTGAARLALGSVAERVLRAATVPVYALRPFWSYEALPAGGPAEQPIRTILVPLSAGGLSLCALPHAVRAAKLFGARVLLLHAENKGEEDASDTVAEASERFRMEGVDSETIIESGAPAEVVLSVCASRRADLVVMSTHGRAGLSRMALGSVTEDVLRRARAPLLVVRGDPDTKVTWHVSAVEGRLAPERPAR